MRRDRNTKTSKASEGRPGWAKASEPAEARLPLRTRQVVGHVTLTGNTGTAWYRLDPVPWSFRPDRDREQHILNQAACWRGCRGSRCGSAAPRCRSRCGSGPRRTTGW